MLHGECAERSLHAIQLVIQHLDVVDDLGKLSRGNGELGRHSLEVGLRECVYRVARRDGRRCSRTDGQVNHRCTDQRATGAYLRC